MLDLLAVRLWLTNRHLAFGRPAYYWLYLSPEENNNKGKRVKQQRFRRSDGGRRGNQTRHLSEFIRTLRKKKNNNPVSFVLFYIQKKTSGRSEWRKRWERQQIWTHQHKTTSIFPSRPSYFNFLIFIFCSSALIPFPLNSTHDTCSLFIHFVFCLMFYFF